MSTAPPSSPEIPAPMRGYWASVVQSMCLLHAQSLRIVEPHAPNLSSFPQDIYAVVSASCQYLVKDACNDELAGKRRADIERRVSNDLWSFLKTWRRDGVVSRETQPLPLGEPPHE
jgi:hypothetical protein